MSAYLRYISRHALKEAVYALKEAVRLLSAYMSAYLRYISRRALTEAVYALKDAVRLLSASIRVKSAQADQIEIE